MIEDIDWTKTDFQDVIDYVAGQIGDQFKNAVLLAQAIVEDPGSFTGPQAASSALKLSVYRLLIGTNAEYYKIRATKTQKYTDRLTKGALIVMYDALEEVINCLKLMSRLEASALNGK